MKKTQKIELIKDDTAPEVLAAAILDIQQSARKLLAGPLKPKALCLLIQYFIPGSDRPTIATIERVLEAAANLGNAWVKK